MAFSRPKSLDLKSFSVSKVNDRGNSFLIRLEKCFKTCSSVKENLYLVITFMR